MSHHLLFNLPEEMLGSRIPKANEAVAVDYSRR
jgi:hypothetical protein